MQHTMTLISGTPDSFSLAERMRFAELVIEGGEVGGAVLTDNIASAKVLAMYREMGAIHGVAALKQPRDSYRGKIEAKAGVALSKTEYPYEIGYIFLEGQLHGRRLSYPIVQAALEGADGAGVFATVRVDNDKMRSTLRRAGFTAFGHSWEGNGKRIIGLLIRPAS
jgi:hypothetical protein